MFKIETKRLQIDEANLGDRTFIFDLLNSPTWIAHIGNRNVHDLKAAEQYIENNLLKSYRENGFGLYVMRTKDALIPIGLCGLINRKGLTHPDLGFAILPIYAQQGFTYEASQAIVKDCKINSDQSELLAITTEENIASQQLLEKLQFKLEGKKMIHEEELLLYRLML